VAQAIGREPLYTPEALHAVFKGSRDVRTDKARAELGYAPRPLEDTLRDTYAFFDRAGRLATRRSPGSPARG
jgi:dihydroflavonol-4-reductase